MDISRAFGSRVEGPPALSELLEVLERAVTMSELASRFDLEEGFVAGLVRQCVVVPAEDPYLLEMVS